MADFSRERRNDLDAAGGVVPYRKASTSLQLVEEERHEEGDGASRFWSILQTLLRRRWLILAVLVLGVSIAASLTLMRVPQYRASATLEVQRQQTQIIEGADVEPTTIADAEHMATQYELLKSRALAERVAEVLDLPADERFADQEASRSDRLTAATNSVMRSIEVLPVSRSRIVEVRVRGPFPTETARIANSVAENFIEMNLERRYNATSYARRFLEERLATTKASLEDAERKLNEYSRQKEILDLSSAGGSELGSSLDASSLIAINAALTEAQQARISAELNFIEARDNPSTRDFLDNEGINALRTKRSELVAEYEEKLSKFQPEWPEMKQLQARIDALDGEIEAERVRFVRALEAKYASAIAGEAALQERVAELKGDVQNLRDRSVEYNILNREADTLRGQYDALLQRFKEVSIASGIGASQVSIVDRAEVPGMPFEPDMRSELLRALVLSLALAIGLALLLEFIDDTIKTPEDIKTKLGIAVLGVVPMLKGKPKISNLLRDPRSPVSEAFSSVRTALQFSTSQGAPRTVLITGVRPAEGKTSSALSMAVAFANTGARVLIVDADLRRPSFAAPSGSSIGLSGYLTQDVPLRDHIVPGAFDNVFLLPAGVIPPNPAELLSSAKIAHLIQEASGQFDLVIFDSPPVLDFADSPSLSAACDATVLVLQAGNIRRPAAIRAVNRLAEAQGNIVGAILTKFDVRRAEYSYGYNYAYSYGYNLDRKSLTSEAKRRRRIEIFNQSDPGGDDEDARRA
jgi:succinoglycan biosynthesis transport protein ExoP